MISNSNRMIVILVLEILISTCISFVSVSFAKENLQSKRVTPDALGYTVKFFDKICEIYADAHNSFLQGTRETKYHTMEASDRKWIRNYEIGQGVFIAKSYLGDGEELVKNYKVEDNRLKNVKTLFIKSIAYRQKSITLYIKTLNSYPQPGLNIESKMNEVKALHIMASRYLLNALDAYRNFLYSSSKDKDSLGTHIEHLNKFYNSVKDDIEDLTGRSYN